MDRIIYMDNAATTKTSQTAIDAMMPYFGEIYGNPSSMHTPGQRAAKAIGEAREAVAGILNASPKEIYFTSGGSEADNQAIISAAHFGAKKGKKHIVSTAIEHHAVLHTLSALKKEGFEITLLDVEPETGLISSGDVEKAIREDTALVTIMYANNEIGTVLPIAEIGEVCRSRGIPFHTDAVQAAGHIYIDVKEQNIDMLSLSGHKFGGPKGVGVLYCRTGIFLKNLINGGSQERGKRAGTENLAGIMGLTAALKESADKLEETQNYLIPLRNRLMERLSKIERSHLNGDKAKRLPNNVNFCFEGIEGESLLLLLDSKGIAASSGSACTSGSLDPSHVLLALGRPHEIAHGSLRLTISEETSREDIEYAADMVEWVVKYLRDMSPVWERIQAGEAEKACSKCCTSCERRN